MNLNSNLIQALIKLYPNVATTVGDIAYDAQGNEIVYDIDAVNAKVAQDESDKLAAQQAAAAHKESAVAKLSAIGLTQDEINALLG